MSLLFPSEIATRLNSDTQTYRFPHEATSPVSNNFRATPLAPVIQALQELLLQSEKSHNKPIPRQRLQQNIWFAIQALERVVNDTILKPQISLGESGDILFTWLQGMQLMDIHILQPNNVRFRLKNLSTQEVQDLSLKNDFSSITGYIALYAQK